MTLIIHPARPARRDSISLQAAQRVRTFGGMMGQSTTSLDALLATIILVTLAIGLPILIVLSIRFLWDRNLNLGRSKELEKLIWQLHRIASALEHQMNLSFPAVQPGTEEPRDIAYLQEVAVQPKAPMQNVATASAATRSAPQVIEEVSGNPPAVAQQERVPPPLQPEVSKEAPRRAGVNSMFDL
jgi:hypothetical protein